MRKAGSNGDVTRDAIRAASLALFFQHGYEAASLRALAREVGITVASLYNYFSSKEDLLVYIIKTAYVWRLARVSTGIAGLDDPYDRLCHFVRFGVMFRTEFRQESIVGDRDINRLPKHVYKEMVILRDSYDTILTDIIEQGVSRGIFSVADARLATFAILGMISSIAYWFHPRGRHSQKAIEDAYVNYALKIVQGTRRS